MPTAPISPPTAPATGFDARRTYDKALRASIEKTLQLFVTCMPEILYLNLRREYFEAIARGKKRIEYRKRSPYWRKRLEGRKYDVILFRNGYARNAPEMVVEFGGLRRYGQGRGAEYAIRLGKILRIKRWRI
jgi:ASC-1-like (ASCH) protein